MSPLIGNGQLGNLTASDKRLDAGKLGSFLLKPTTLHLWFTYTDDTSWDN